MTIPGKHFFCTVCLLAVFLIFSLDCRSADKRTLEVEIPVTSSADASVKIISAARASGKAYLVDLTTGDDGIAFRGKYDLKLEPGRYRLHVLVGAGPANNNVVDPVELYLCAGSSYRKFLPREIPKSGELSDLFLDFTVDNETPVVLLVKWNVGDSLLDVSPQEKAKAFQKLLARRKSDILRPKQPSGSIGEKQSETEELGAEDESAVALVDIAKTAEPKFRLAVAGMHVETLCPIVIESVQTDKAAYLADESVKVEVKLRNLSRSEVQAALSTELASADKVAGAPAAESRKATVAVPAGSSISYKLPEDFKFHGLGALAKITVLATWKDTRPAIGESLLAMMPPVREAKPSEKKIFAHYMGCWPAGTGPILFQRQNEATEMRHEAQPSSAYYYGGHVRNFDLVDPVKQLTADESADLEIRRAMRIGIDGFAVDAWAGGDSARQTLDSLFKVAEEKDYKFELTVCIDPTCGGRNVETVKELLDKHGKSPKLARRNGKPLIFGYQSIWGGYEQILKYAPDRVDELRAQPIGWHILGQSLNEAARQVGQPIYFHYCMNSFFFNIDAKRLQKDSLVQASGILARYADAVGGFVWLGPEQAEIGKVVRAAGAEWSMPVGMYQKENIPFECYVAKGTDWMHWGRGAFEQDATLLQIVTWNDYGENTNIAPAWNTRYTLYDLTGYEIKLWKTGKDPVPDHDRVYLVYRKYPPNAKIFPFHAKFQGVEPGVIEVLSILTKPATIRLPGRKAEYEAPAGMYRKQFPVTAGPMIAELVRDGKVELRLESPEPITDKPFREDNGLVCWSSEEERLWKEDFGNTKPFWYSEYGDVDNDGLPNWFEMYWFSKERGFQPKTTDSESLDEKPAIKYSRWLDFPTQSYADPKEDSNGDGKTNLEHYREQSDPARPSANAEGDKKNEGLEQKQ